MKERPEKSNRGRKPEKEDEYITKSKQSIKMWTAQLEAIKDDPSMKEEYKSLYNKKTALQSRVRKKLQQ